MGRLFGTDGVRGVANRELTAELGVALGSAAARRLARSAGRRVAVIGRDPRASGEMLEVPSSRESPAKGSTRCGWGCCPRRRWRI